MRILIAAALLFAAPAAAVQAPDWTRAQTVTVRLSNFDFDPSTIRLAAGVPVTLRLTSRGGHDFSAPAFFAAARLHPDTAARVRRGKVEVGGGETVELRLVPAAGRYRLRCTHFLHSTFGMNGEIVVQ